LWGLLLGVATLSIVCVHVLVERKLEHRMLVAIDRALRLRVLVH
jgi:hypothetical protein